KCQELYELLDANADKLTEYGITPDIVASVRVRIDAFAEAIGKKESGVSDRTSARKNLHELFDETDALLTGQIDLMMEMFRKRETQFYNEYFQARFIWNMGAPRKAKQPVQVAEPVH
ncbi:MAG: hypothetical protein NTZ35_00045, partial [Ignavibacteriales bacterium]|nr:hypothetical protein [Ignavibacteriales bacterium]